MNTINDGGPAFPVPDSHYPNGQVQYGCNGMSLRAYFAGQALNGMLSDPNCAEGYASAAIHAAAYADALIAELNKTQQ
jgi:hypothetical protein